MMTQMHPLVDRIFMTKRAPGTSVSTSIINAINSTFVFTHLFIKKILFSSGLLSLMVSVSHASEHLSNAEPSEKKQILMLLWRGMTPAEEGFVDALSSDKNINITIRNTDKNITQLESFIKDISVIKPDLIYTFGTTITLKVLGTTNKPSTFSQSSTIPVVFNIVSDPVGSGIVDHVDQLQRKENFTGVSHIVPYDVQLNVIKELGTITRVGVLYNPVESNSRLAANNLIALGPSHQLEVKRYPILRTNDGINLDDISGIAREMIKDDINLVYLPADSFLISNAKPILDIIHSKGLPTFSATESPIRHSGALLGIVSRYYYAGQFAAFKAKQILNEKQYAGEIPIETLRQFSYIVNVDTANQLEYFPPVSMLKISELVRNTDVVQKK